MLSEVKALQVPGGVAKLTKKSPTASGEEARAEREARVTSRLKAADDLELKWLEQPPKDALVALTLWLLPWV